MVCSTPLPTPTLTPLAYERLHPGNMYMCQDDPGNTFLYTETMCGWFRQPVSAVEMTNRRRVWNTSRWRTDIESGNPEWTSTNRLDFYETRWKDGTLAKSSWTLWLGSGQRGGRSFFNILTFSPVSQGIIQGSSYWKKLAYLGSGLISWSERNLDLRGLLAVGGAMCSPVWHSRLNIYLSREVSL